MDFSSIQSLLLWILDNKPEFLIGIIGLESLCTFALVVSSFVVAGTANAGFNVVFTGFLNIAYISGSCYVLKNSKAPIAVRIPRSVAYF
jgi:hypothetical protein